MEKRKYTKHLLTAGGGTINVDITQTEPYALIYTSAAVALTSNWTIQPSGTPTNGMVANIVYVADVTPGGNNITIFGNKLSVDECSSSMEILLFYDGSEWWVVKKVNNDDLSISVDNIGTATLDGSVLIDSSVDYEKISITDARNILKGNGSGGAEEIAMETGKLLTSDGSKAVVAEIGGDLSATYSAPLTLNFYIADKAVTLAKLNDIPEGSLISGGTLNAPTHLDARGDGKFVCGDGSKVRSLWLDGDVHVVYNRKTEKMDVRVTHVSSYEDSVLVSGAGSGYVKTYIQELKESELDGNLNEIINIGNIEGAIVGSKLYVKSAASAGKITVKSGLGGNYYDLHSAVDTTTPGVDEYDLDGIGFKLFDSVFVQSNIPISGGDIAVVIQTI